MEVTKSSEALRCKRVTLGDLATMRAATRSERCAGLEKGNAEADPAGNTGKAAIGWEANDKRTGRFRRGIGGGTHGKGGMDATRETPSVAWHARTGTPRGAGRAGRVAERLV